MGGEEDSRERRFREDTMPAGSVVSGVRDGFDAENELIAWRKRVHSRKFLFHQEIGAQSLSPRWVS